MSVIAEANAAIENAKQQRAELVGPTVLTHALPIAAVVAMAFAFLQFAGEPQIQQQFDGRTAQVSTTQS